MHRSSSIFISQFSRFTLLLLCGSAGLQIKPSSARWFRMWAFCAIVCILALILRCFFFTETAHIKSRLSRNNILIGCMEKPHHVSFLFVLVMPLRSLCLRAILSMCCVMCAREFRLHMSSVLRTLYVLFVPPRLNGRPETVTKRGGDFASNNNKPRPNDMLVTIYVLFVTHVFSREWKICDSQLN